LTSDHIIGALDSQHHDPSWSDGEKDASQVIREAGERASVKHGFYNLTKEQVGRDWQGKDIMNDHQGKALREGCHEREWARMSVSSRKKNNTKRNLVIVTTKSKSKMQTVSNGHVS